MINNVPRRVALQRLGAVIAGVGLLSSARAPAQSRTRFVLDPFSLGVASGYPTRNGISLWTRFAPAPLRIDGGMSDEPVAFVCEVASDENFQSIVRTVNAEAYPEVAHSVHLDIDGLAPGRSYFYRFQSGDATSRVGRFATLPDNIDAYRIAFGSCQNFEHGYFSAYRQMQRDDPQLVLFLGDYIYESQWGADPIRRHFGPESMTLAQYRTRHAQYKLDADLQAMHAAVPFAFAWDDHEVDNDYAGDVSENLDPQFFKRRIAAYQAFFEHMPLPRRMFPQRDEMRIYTHFDIGSLLRIYLLDDRQYRTPQPCPRANRVASQVLDRCDETALAHTLLGATQEAWLDKAFSSSRAQWNLIAQQTLFAPLDESPGAARGLWTDGWDGYPQSRQRVLDALRKTALRNPVIVGGDLHANVVAAVPGDPERFDSPPIASEFVATSISADARPQTYYDERGADNPHVQLMRSDIRGYTLLDIGRDRVEAKLQAVSDVRVREPSFSTLARFVVEDGKAGPVR